MDLDIDTGVCGRVMYMEMKGGMVLLKVLANLTMDIRIPASNSASFNAMGHGDSTARPTYDNCARRPVDANETGSDIVHGASLVRKV
jgi:hypothetical protein